MSDSEKPMGLPPYYWAKPPKRQKLQSSGFVNKEQRRFYMVLTALKVVRVVAFAAVALLIVGMI
jgi:Tfp pilus assembly protein PilN